jgi:hypothetical protein
MDELNKNRIIFCVMEIAYNEVNKRRDIGDFFLFQFLLSTVGDQTTQSVN